MISRVPQHSGIVHGMTGLVRAQVRAWRSVRHQAQFWCGLKRVCENPATSSGAPWRLKAQVRAHKRKAGPSTPLRSGRDDNSVSVSRDPTKLSSRPERSGVEGPAFRTFKPRASRTKRNAARLSRALPSRPIPASCQAVPCHESAILKV